LKNVGVKDPEIIINENNDSDPILNYSGNTCKLGCVRPSEGISHSSPTHALKREHTTTRAGRKVIVPSRFIDSVEFNNMGVKCEHCGVEYANRRNLKRHFNAVHSENVKYVACCMHNCDRIFFRREYLLVHLETTHKLPREEAKDLSHRVNLEYVDRQFVEPCGPTEKKLKTTVVLPCDLEANNNEKHDDESGVEPVPGPSQYGASEQVGDDDMAIITEEVEEDIVIQEDASEFDAEVEVEEIDEIYVSDEEPPADTSSVEIISLSLITIRTESDGINFVKREHHFSTSKHHDPRNFNWREFLSYMEEELCRHAEALWKREADVQEL
jgi:hypothetical protein